MALARRENKLVRLQDAGWAKVAAGTTTLEEFGRVAKSGQAKKKAKKK
jgi:type II secretory ATPase GspE/PulE/Tfp pilus assembly ATPase PilB-like protein